MTSKLLAALTSLTITNFQATNQWKYDVVATNLVGAATSSVATLYLDSPLRFTNTARTVTNSFTALLLGKANTNYIFQASTNLAKTNWVPILTNSSPYGIMSFVDTNLRSYSNRFFRAVETDHAGKQRPDGNPTESYCAEHA